MKVVEYDLESDFPILSPRVLFEKFLAISRHSGTTNGLDSFVTIMRLVAVACLVVCLVWMSEGVRHGRVACVTEDLYMQKEGSRPRGGSCPTKGSCDRPSNRDKYGSSKTPVVIRSAVHVMNSNNGTDRKSVV